MCAQNRRLSCLDADLCVAVFINQLNPIAPGVHSAADLTSERRLWILLGVALTNDQCFWTNQLYTAPPEGLVPQAQGFFPCFCDQLFWCVHEKTCHQQGNMGLKVIKWCAAALPEFSENPEARGLLGVPYSFFITCHLRSSLFSFRKVPDTINTMVLPGSHPAKC